VSGSPFALSGSDGCVSFGALSWMARQGDWMRIFVRCNSNRRSLSRDVFEIRWVLKIAPAVDATCESLLKYCLSNLQFLDHGSMLIVLFQAILFQASTGY
jgi:hypothetical protein